MNKEFSMDFGFDMVDNNYQEKDPLWGAAALPGPSGLHDIRVDDEDQYSHSYAPLQTLDAPQVDHLPVQLGDPSTLFRSKERDIALVVDGPQEDHLFVHPESFFDLHLRSLNGGQFKISMRYRNDEFEKRPVINCRKHQEEVCCPLASLDFAHQRCCICIQGQSDDQIPEILYQMEVNEEGNEHPIAVVTVSASLGYAVLRVNIRCLNSCHKDFDRIRYLQVEYSDYNGEKVWKHLVSSAKMPRRSAESLKGKGGGILKLPIPLSKKGRKSNQNYSQCSDEPEGLSFLAQFKDDQQDRVRQYVEEHGGSMDAISVPLSVFSFRDQE